MYNLMTCENLGTSILGGCTFAWLSLLLIFLLALVFRRQSEDGIFTGISYNFIAALILGLGSVIILLTLLGEPRWALLGGIVGIIIGGFGIGYLSNSGREI